MAKYIILSEKSWHKKLHKDLEMFFKSDKWNLIDNKKDFCLTNLKKIKPNKIFIPHWSYIIPEEIYNNFECVLFHMTDLPFGRGGSPLQNLIVREHTETKISALKVVKELDEGPIYLKKKMSLQGSAEEIYTRANKVIKLMIIEMISKNLAPKQQHGKIVKFKRRKPKDSNINEVEDLKKVYDYIRMLDAEGYPHAFLETSNLKFEFTNANFNQKNEIITANVRIFKK